MSAWYVLIETVREEDIPTVHGVFPDYGSASLAGADILYDYGLEEEDVNEFNDHGQIKIDRGHFLAIVASPL